jgi:hypothetical protein
MSKTEKIIELKELLDSGLISSDDFERLKKQIFEEPEKVSFEIKKIKQVDILDNVRQKRNIFYDSIKKCTKCGSDNKLENQICSVCKSDFPIVESKTEQKNYIENKKSDYKFYIFGILGFVLLFFGVSYFINNHNDKEQKESEVPTALESISLEPVPTVSVEENNNKKLSDTILNIYNYIGNWTDGNTDISIGNDKSFSMGNSVCSSIFTYTESGSELILVFEDVLCKIQIQDGNNRGQEVGKCYIQNGELIVEFKNISELEGTGIESGNYKKGSKYD